MNHKNDYSYSLYESINRDPVVRTAIHEECKRRYRVGDVITSAFDGSTHTLGKNYLGDDVKLSERIVIEISGKCADTGIWFSLYYNGHYSTVKTKVI